MEYEYEWDDGKAARNLAKHSASFESVKDFEWSRASVKEDRRREYGEVRFIAVGYVNGRLHVLVFTRRGVKVRVIGLRKANAREIVRYENSQET